MPIIKEVKVFTRESPCTKVHIHNCFITEQGYGSKAVVEARGDIGLNTPKYLLREGYMHAYTQGGVDYYMLTSEGVVWLTEGLKRHLELHPEDEPLVMKAVKTNRVVRRRFARS